MTKRKDPWEKISDAFGGQFELVGETGETQITPCQQRTTVFLFQPVAKVKHMGSGI